jgi:hypothetical protein
MSTTAAFPADARFAEQRITITGTEAPASKRAFARHARRYARDGHLVYRHLVPSVLPAFAMRLAARVTLALIRRGFRYVPLTTTGIALLGWLSFVFADAAPCAPRVPARRLPRTISFVP